MSRWISFIHNPLYILWLHQEIERDKARLVAKGFTLKEDIDYTETFFPLSKKDSLRII